MKYFPQGTVAAPIALNGPGLHTGKNHHIRILPAPANSGIVFEKMPKRWGGANHPIRIPATWKAVKTLPLCTCLVAETGEKIRTVEHLLAAFYACGVDNALIQVEGREIPVLDGSAKEFIAAIDSTGVTEQDFTRVQHKVIQTTTFSEGDRNIMIEPAETLSLNISILLKHFGHLRWQGEIDPSLFKQEMSGARTFGRFKNGLLAQLTRFKKDPICLGANLNTALVLDNKNAVLNKEGFRMENEIIYHRVLDLMGDLMLAGGHLQGKITAKSSAHRLNHGLLQNLFTQGHIETQAAKPIS